MAVVKADRAWPDVAIPPGETLAEELEARGWSQSELARRMRRPVQAINEIMRGVKQITADTALQLGEVLGTSAEFWMNLEGGYRLCLARRHHRKAIVEHSGGMRWKNLSTSTSRNRQAAHAFGGRKDAGSGELARESGPRTKTRPQRARRVAAKRKH